MDHFFDQQNYRILLKTWIKSLPERGYGELSRIAAHLGVNSALISQVFSGKKEFTFEQGFRITKYMGLDDFQSEYFMALLQRERAGDHEYKKHWDQKIQSMQSEALNLKNRVKKDRSLSDFEKATYYSSYMYGAIRLFCSIGDGKTLSEISEMLDLSREKTSEAIRFLQDIRLLREAEGSKYQMTEASLFIDRDSPLIKKHHLNWRLQTLKKIEKLSDDELCITFPYSISEKDFKKIREILVSAVQQIQMIVKESPAEKVAYLNIDFFRFESI